MEIRIPLTNPRQAYLSHREDMLSAVTRVLDGGWYILGKEVSAFEDEFARYCGAEHCVGVANGTDAVELALRSLAVGPGDAVFTVAHTAVATISAIERTGATPVVVDISSDTYTIDPQKLKDSIQACDGLVPRAIVGVHLYGHLCDVNSIQDIGRTHGLFFVEDCAQAHGASFRGQRTGTFGDAAAFSFYPTKNLGAFGDAGAVLFADQDLSEKCRGLREYGWIERNSSDFPGINSRLDELQAALLRVRLRTLDDEINQRRTIAQRYDRGLAGAVAVPVCCPEYEHAYHLYVIRTPDRDDLKKSLAEAGIGSAVHYPTPVHLQPAYRGRILLGAGGLPVTEQYAGQILSLPMHGFLAESDADEVVEAVNNWASTQRAAQ